MSDASNPQARKPAALLFYTPPPTMAFDAALSDDDDGVVLVQGYVAGNQVVFHCQWCRAWHFHGYNASERRANSDLHRWSHCHHPGSAFNGRDLRIKVIAELPQWCRNADGTVKLFLDRTEARRFEQWAAGASD
jgi:hypothetical protein